jgi:cell division septation protein DedD
MSAERKKLLWIALSATVFVLVLAATGFFLFAPKKSGGGLAAPASVGNVAVPKATDPQDFLMAPPPPPPSDQSRSGDVIVVYGDKPANLGGAPQAGSSAQLANGAAVPGGTVPPSNDNSLAAAQGSLGGPTQANSAAAGASIRQSGAVIRQSASPAKPSASETRRSVATAKPALKTAASYRERTKPEPAAPKVRTTEYWIQAASFTSRDRADSLKHALANKGIASLITVKDIAGSSWYRVRVGPYSIKAEAESWLSKVQSIEDCASASLWTDVALRGR